MYIQYNFIKGKSFKTIGYYLCSLNLYLLVQFTV